MYRCLSAPRPELASTYAKAEQGRDTGTQRRWPHVRSQAYCMRARDCDHPEILRREVLAQGGKTQEGFNKEMKRI